jgi:ribose/xylose/arabinose/galactoside ABC-type transport system permease subunit
VFEILTKGTFLKLINIRSILNMIVITMTLTICVCLLMISGSIDLSTGAIGTLCGLLFGIFLRDGMAWYFALIISLAFGILMGCFNATLIHVVGFQPFIATLAVASVAQGFTYIVNDSLPVSIQDEFTLFVGTKRLFDVIPITLIIAIVIYILYSIMLTKTKFGRTIFLVGGNRVAAKMSGLHPTRISYILFMNAGMLSAFGGVLLAARTKSATVTGTTAMQFSGMTAAMLGGISFGGGAGGLGGIIIGLLIINGFNNGLTLIRINQYWQTVASGALLLFALIIDYVNNKRRRIRV